MKKKNIQLNLTATEKKNLRKRKIRIAEILEYAPEELEQILQIPEERAKVIYALADFQQVPSIGIEFAKDLIFLGYYSIDELSGKTGAELTDAFEKKKGFKTDPCVEDQFRLAVHYCKYQDHSKKWWDFTQERKNYRSEFGYPSDRPILNWTDVDPD